MIDGITVETLHEFKDGVDGFVKYIKEHPMVVDSTAAMLPDRSWKLCWKNAETGEVCEEIDYGVDSFIKSVKEHPMEVDSARHILYTSAGLPDRSWMLCWKNAETWEVSAEINRGVDSFIKSVKEHPMEVDSARHILYTSSMLPDRSWKLCWKNAETGEVSEEIDYGVDSFIKSVKEHPMEVDSARQILCPSAMLPNRRWKLSWVNADIDDRVDAFIKSVKEHPTEVDSARHILCPSAGLPSRSWKLCMMDREDRETMDEFEDGVDGFIKYIKENSKLVDSAVHILCPSAMLPCRTWKLLWVNADIDDGVDAFIKSVKEHPMEVDSARHILCPSAGLPGRSWKLCMIDDITVETLHEFEDGVDGIVKYIKEHPMVVDSTAAGLPGRSWKLCRMDRDDGETMEEFEDGVDGFIKYIKEHPMVVDCAAAGLPGRSWKLFMMDWEERETMHKFEDGVDGFIKYIKEHPMVVDFAAAGLPGRSWKLCMIDGITVETLHEFEDGVDGFVKYIKEHPMVVDSTVDAPSEVRGTHMLHDRGKEIWVERPMFRRFRPTGITNKIMKEVMERLPSFAPTWKDYPWDMKESLYAMFVATHKFIDPEDERHGRKVWDRTCQDRYPESIRNLRFAGLKKNNTTDVAQTRGKPPMGIKLEVWNQFVDYWLSEKFQRRSKAAKANRRALPDAAVHSGGSISFAVTRERMENEKGGPVPWRDVYEHTHKKKGTGEFVSEHSREVLEKLDAGLARKYGDDRSKYPEFDRDIWLEAAPPNKKGRVEGLGGSVALPIDSCNIVMGPSCSRRSQAQKSEIHEMNEKINTLQKNMENIQQSMNLFLSSMASSRRDVGASSQQLDPTRDANNGASGSIQMR